MIVASWLLEWVLFFLWGIVSTSFRLVYSNRSACLILNEFRTKLDLEISIDEGFCRHI